MRPSRHANFCSATGGPSRPLPRSAIHPYPYRQTFSDRNRTSGPRYSDRAATQAHAMPCRPIPAVPSANAADPVRPGPQPKATRRLTSSSSACSPFGSSPAPLKRPAHLPPRPRSAAMPHATSSSEVDVLIVGAGPSGRELSELGEGGGRDPVADRLNFQSCSRPGSRS